MDLFSFVEPSEQTPLFTAQHVTCAYPISDIWASTPRYLYYSLLVIVLVLRTRSWIVHVFLGAAATYAGTAAILTFILFANQPKIPNVQWVTIPFIDPASIPDNATFAALPNLVSDAHAVGVAPAIMELDIDATLAVVVTGYLTMLPLHCWSHTVRAYRSLHVLVGAWNVMMLAGSICALLLWPTISWDNFPFQFRFCYPDFPDGTETINDSPEANFYKGTWNDTVWATFQNVTAGLSRSDNCLYPCFTRSSILRQAKAATASLNTNKNPRTSNTISDAEYNRFNELTLFMYRIVALSLSTFLALFLLILNISGLRRFTRVPVHRPQSLWSARKELWHALSSDIRSAFWTTRTTLTSPRRSISHPPSISRLKSRSIALLRLLTDIAALVALFLATVFVPLTTVVFIVWIEWYIHRDFISEDSPKLVSQWSPVAAIGLVLFSALILKLRYWIAPKEEVEHDIRACRTQLERLEALQERRLERERRSERARHGEQERGQTTPAASVVEMVGVRKGASGSGEVRSAELSA